MVNRKLSEGLRQYESWKQQVGRTMDDIQAWLEKHDLFTEEAWNTFARCLDKLETDRITIAFVGEFSRGKTELINSLFFSDSGRRLLPSDAGRTTMCPTEILYDDEQDEAYIRLLPIETRLREESLTELRKAPEEWIEFPLDLADTDALENTLKELANTRHVTPEEAARYGLLSEHFSQPQARQPKYVDIPRWRHAIVSYPHPMLRQGLTILDTPGLNAIGSEPELTLTMLPSAQAAVFVLGADTGVTQSDLDIWQNHLKGHQKSRRKGLTVVLNKIDTLWDELRPQHEIDKTIKSQILYTARILGVPLRQIFPVSAQKSLIALVRNEQALLSRTGLVELEDHLNHEVTEAKQLLIMDDINGDITDLLSGIRTVLHSRMTVEEEQIEEIANIHQQSDSAITQLMGKTRDEQERYRRNFSAFTTCQTTMNRKTQELQEMLDPRVFERLLQQAQSSMEKSWTTRGIANAIDELLGELNRLMDDVTRHVSEDRQLIKNIYQRFQQDHGIGVIQPRAYSIMDHAVQLKLINEEAQAFSKGYRIALSGHAAIIKSFFNTIGIKARQLFHEMHKDIEHWIESSLQPLSFQIEDHRDILNRQLQDLKLANQSRETVDDRLAELADSIEQLNARIRQIDNFVLSLTTFHQSRPKARPYLVSNNAS